MKITRCSGAEVHFFDGDKYSVCPVCGKPEADNNQTSQIKPESKLQQEAPVKKGFFFGKGKKDKTPAYEEVKANNYTEEKECGTVAMTEAVSLQMEEPSNPSMPQQASQYSTISKMVPPIPPVPTPVPTPQPISQTTPQPVSTPAASYDSAKTVGVYADANTEPVVGWLICVKGESLGESFNLKAGKNSIGRGAGMDVMLAQERSVSRDKHAIITYEPKKRIFLIQPGESSGLVYLNDELLMSFAQLSAYDTIQLGEAIFKFLPFCGESFVWEDYLED